MFVWLEMAGKEQKEKPEVLFLNLEIKEEMGGIMRIGMSFEER